MAINIPTLALSRKYTDESVSGGGTIKGKNCQIQSITSITGGHRVVFVWYLDDNTEQTSTMDVMDGDKGDTGLGIKSVAVSAYNHLIVTYVDNTQEDAGEITNITTNFAHITDIDLDNLTDGQILKYNGTSQKWENASAGSVSTDLGDLNDVDFDNLSDGQIIVWDATNSKWVNAANSPSITVDSVPTEGSTNAVSSGGVYTALAGKVDAVSGKILSDNNYSDADAAAVAALGTAASLDVAESGDASTTEVVKGDDSRLTDSRNAADVYSWAKASTKPSYAYSEITNTPTLGTASAKDSTNAVTSASTDLVESGAVYTALGDKADKVTSATSGHLASLDSNGNLADSGKSADDIIVQVSTLPTASASNLGRIYEYVGATGTYTNGLFYKCVTDGSAYSWAVVDVVDTLTASDVTDIKNAFVMQAYSDRGIIIDERGTELAVGVVIDSNGVEHTLYQKFITGETSRTENQLEISHNIQNIDWIYNISGGLHNSYNNDIIPVQFINAVNLDNVPFFGVLAGRETIRLRYSDSYKCSDVRTFTYRIILEYTKTT